ncbi:putative histidine phosphatase superfamily [Helianthus anomalus]
MLLWVLTVKNWIFKHMWKAQGIHNVIGDKDYKAYMSPKYFNVELTPLGWHQVENLSKHVHASGLAKKIDVVITSPLLRTMQTTVGVFGGEGYTDTMDALPLMLANVGNSGRSTISGLNCPPFIAVELCREHLGVHPCDRRRSVSEYQCLFPAVDFSLASAVTNTCFLIDIESHGDVLWKANIREAREELTIRGKSSLIGQHVMDMEGKEIAIVTHSGFLFHTLATFGNNCHLLVRKEITKHFANDDLRSMVIVDKRWIFLFQLFFIQVLFIFVLFVWLYITILDSLFMHCSSMLGSDSSMTDYPGRIQCGLDTPSDKKTANDKLVSGST